MRVLYIYSGKRGGKYHGQIGKDYPDTAFYGLNHLKEFGIDAEYKELEDIPLLSFFSWLPFSLKHTITTIYFSLFGDYEIIFGSSLIYGLFFKNIFKLKQKMVLLDISLGRTIAANNKSIFKTQIINAALFSADAVVTLSEYQKQSLESKFPELKSKIYVVRLGVDTNYLKPNFSGRKDYFLSIGRDDGRDYSTVFKLAKMMPESHFEIICSHRNIAGLGDYPSNVSVIFDLPYKETYKKLLESKALLLITHSDSYEDGSDCSGQTVLLEAMASGIPVIATNKKYIDEYAKDGKSIILVEPYNEKDLMEKIVSLDTKNSEDQVKFAREEVESKFSSREMALNLSKVFKNVVNHE